MHKTEGPAAFLLMGRRGIVEPILKVHIVILYSSVCFILGRTDIELIKGQAKGGSYLFVNVNHFARIRW